MKAAKEIQIFCCFSLQSERFSHNVSLLDFGHIQQTAAMLTNATLHTEKFYGSDVKVAYRLTQSLLRYESSQQGFNLTATQDVHFTEVSNQVTPLTLKRAKNMRRHRGRRATLVVNKCPAWLDITACSRSICRGIRLSSFLSL